MEYFTQACWEQRTKCVKHVRHNYEQ